MTSQNNETDTVKLDELPLSFQVKYLGHQPARGLWGIKHTRSPVDLMVKNAKTLPPGEILPFVRLTVWAKGVTISYMTVNNRNDKLDKTGLFSIETISYGVQDLVYTRVFSIIVVQEDANIKEHQHPFECHAFVCESKNSARRLTYALAAAFQDYSRRVQEQTKEDQQTPVKKRFAIDLRTPEEMQEEMDAETEA